MVAGVFPQADQHNPRPQSPATGRSKAATGWSHELRTGPDCHPAVHRDSQCSPGWAAPPGSVEVVSFFAVVWWPLSERLSRSGCSLLLVRRQPEPRPGADSRENLRGATRPSLNGSCPWHPPSAGWRCPSPPLAATARHRGPAGRQHPPERRHRSRRAARAKAAHRQRRGGRAG